MILVTGMHRSGTSLVASLLSELGVDFGHESTFYPADAWNQRGYFEQKEVMDLNCRLITGFRRNHGSLERLLYSLIYTTLPNPRRRLDRLNRFRSEVRGVGEKYRGLALKDPRFCLTLEFWRSEVAVEKVVVCLRDPAATVASLLRRQSYPRWAGYRFWNYHIDSLLSQLPARNVLFLSFDALASEEFESDLRQILSFFPLDLDLPEAASRYRRVFDPALRHFQPGLSGRTPPPTRALWNRLHEHYSRSLERHSPRS